MIFSLTRVSNDPTSIILTSFKLAIVFSNTS
nr:MAG TPA: hypothetical protein [Bacteriophage sp.]